MDQDHETITAYKQQLIQINAAIAASTSQDDINSLISLKNDIQQLLCLTNDDGSDDKSDFDDEYASFMAEMEKEGAYGNAEKPFKKTGISERDLNELEGTKCRAPHVHSWGEKAYHNAMICSVIHEDDVKVKVMFINPTHSEMLPCPYFLDTECKFSEDKCRFSHGEIVSYSEIKEYVEPKFDLVGIGTKVLAKKDNNLWHRATVKRFYNQKCLVKFDSHSKDEELELHDVFPLDNTVNEEIDMSDEENVNSVEDVINMSLMITPAQQSLGEWEKHTRGIGTKLMEKMGYITGTGLGRNSNGRLEPISAVILPPGKSLDHCMHLREKAGGDKNLFSVERKLKRQQKKQELRNQKAYEREKNKVDVFNFLNDKLTIRKDKSIDVEKSKHSNEIKGESSRSLNVASMKIEEEEKAIQRELCKIRDSLKRHSTGSQVHKSLKMKQHHHLHQLQLLQEQAVNIKSEQRLRNDKKKMTIF